jgi:hypothetical protein
MVRECHGSSPELDFARVRLLGDDRLTSRCSRRHRCGVKPRDRPIPEVEPGGKPRTHGHGLITLGLAIVTLLWLIPGALVPFGALFAAADARTPDVSAQANLVVAGYGIGLVGLLVALSWRLAGAAFDRSEPRPEEGRRLSRTARARPGVALGMGLPMPLPDLHLYAPGRRSRSGRDGPTGVGEDDRPNWVKGLGAGGEIIHATRSAGGSWVAYFIVGIVAEIVAIASLGSGAWLAGGIAALLGVVLLRGAVANLRSGLAAGPVVAFDTAGVYVASRGFVPWSRVTGGQCALEPRYRPRPSGMSSWGFAWVLTLMVRSDTAPLRRRWFLPRSRRHPQSISGTERLAINTGTLALSCDELLARMDRRYHAATGRQFDTGGAGSRRSRT